MNAVMGMIGILRDSPLTTEQKECINMMSDSSTSLLNLLNNFLDFTKMESENVEIEVTLPLNVTNNCFIEQTFQSPSIIDQHDSNDVKKYSSR